MFKGTKKKFAALLLAVLILVSSQAVAGIENAPSIGSAMLSTEGNIDWVALYLEERGLTREDIGLPPAGAPAAAPVLPPPPPPAAGATDPGAAVPTLPAPVGNVGGFIPSTRFPFDTVRNSIQSHANINREVVAWLMIPGTNMNFPVTLNSNNNRHYLYRDWRGNDFTGRLTWRNWSDFPDTAIYMDFRSSIGTTWATSSRNMSLYGHNWTNLRPPLRIGNHTQDRMFAQLKSYTCINFATRNPHIYFSTGNMEGIWRVFAVGYAHTTPFFFYNNPNPTRTGLETLIGEWRHRSHINFNVDVNANDRILTLTTCTRVHGNTETQRFVVVARLLRPGESENDVVTATPNQNIRHPDFTLPTRLPPGHAAAAAAAAQAQAAPPVPVVTAPGGGAPPQTLFGGATGE